MFDRLIAGGVRGPWFEDHFSRPRPAVRARRCSSTAATGGSSGRWWRPASSGEAVGIDYSDDLLEEARREAGTLGLPLTYHQMNVNTAEFPPGPFDLVVNYAAAHHIAMIDRVFRRICTMLPEDGCFLSFDYVGPHRNQYSTVAWERAWAVNNELPEHLRQSMAYPNVGDHAAGRPHRGDPLRADRRDPAPVLPRGEVRAARRRHRLSDPDPQRPPLRLRGQGRAGLRRGHGPPGRRGLPVRAPRLDALRLHRRHPEQGRARPALQDRWPIWASGSRHRS